MEEWWFDDIYTNDEYFWRVVRNSRPYTDGMRYWNLLQGIPIPVEANSNMILHDVKRWSNLDALEKVTHYYCSQKWIRINHNELSAPVQREDNFWIVREILNKGALRTTWAEMAPCLCVMYIPGSMHVKG
mgnify:CR=1 FL=1